MAKKGLRSFNNFLSTDFTLGESHFCLNSNNDLFINIPLLTKDDISPIELSLIYNNEDVTLQENFGKGFKPSFYFNIAKTNNVFQVIFADGFIVDYTYDPLMGIYTNNYDKSFIMLGYDDSNQKIYFCFESGDRYVFNIDGKNDITAAWVYPEKIVNYYDKETTFSKENNILTIQCYKGYNIKIYTNSNNYVTNVDILNKSNSYLIYRYNFTYLNGCLISMIRNVTNEAYIDRCDFTYSQNNINNITSSPYNDNISFIYNENTIVSIVDAKNKSTISINKANKETTLTNERNEISRYYFDNNGFLSCYKDYKGYFKYYKFNSTGKLITQSKAMIINDHDGGKINLIQNGDFHNSAISPWRSTNDYNYSINSDSLVLTEFANNSLTLTQNGNSSYHGIYQNINADGYAGDVFTLFFLAQYLLASNIQIILEVYNNTTLVESITKTTSISSLVYEPCCLTFQINYAYTSLKLKILTKSTVTTIGPTTIYSSLKVSAIQFIKGSLEEDNTYNGNKLIKTIKNNISTDLYYYHPSIKSTSSIAKINNNTFSSSFDKKDANGNFNEVTINSKYTKINKKDEFGNTIKSVMYYKDKYIKKSYEYDINHTLLIKEINENNITSEYFYYNDYLINEISVNDNKQKYYYNTKRKNDKISFYQNQNNLLFDNVFTYSIDYKIEEINCVKDNTYLARYEYFYNNNDLLSEVTFLSTYSFSLEKYEYENITTSFPRYITKKLYGNNFYNFTYDSSGEKLLQVSYLGYTKYIYSYDNLDRLVCVSNSDASVEVSYSYDDYFNIKTISDRTASYSYYYEDENNLLITVHNIDTANSLVYTLPDKKYVFDDKNSLIHQLEKIDGVYVLTLCRYCDNAQTEEIEGKISTDIYNYSNGVADILRTSISNALFDTTTYPFNTIAIKSFINEESNNFSINVVSKGGNEKISLGFFYTNLIQCKKEITRISMNSSMDFIAIGVDENNKIYYTFACDNNSGVTYNTDIVINQPLQHVKVDINLQPFSITIHSNGLTYTNNFIINLGVDVRLWYFKNTQYFSDQHSILGIVAFPYISFSNEFVVSDTRELIESLVEKLKTITSTEQYTRDIFNIQNLDETLRSFTIYPLNGSFKSLNGKGLFYKEGLDGYLSSFIYDNVSKQNVYRPLENSKLFIDPSLSSSGTIIIKFYYSSSTSGTIFELSSDRVNTFIKAFIENGKLMIERNVLTNRIMQSTASIQQGWNTLSLSFKYQNASGVLLSRVLLKIMLNNTINDFSFSYANNIVKQYLSIGNSFATDSCYSGFLSDLIFDNTYVNNYLTFYSILLSLNKKLSFVNTKDELGRHISDEIYYNSSHVITKNYGYNNIFPSSSQVGTIINSLNIQSNTKTYNSYFSFNNNLLVNNFYTSNYGYNSSVNYSYDTRNRLQTVYMLQNQAVTFPLYTYTYDDNGNILTINGNDNTFDYISGNRISRYNNTYFYYNSDDPFLIDQIEQQDNDGNILNTTYLSYIGRRLISYQGEGNTITFAYDHQGNRIRKTVNGVTKEYYYEGNKLIATKINNNYVYYFYDNNSVAGFIYNNNYYFYVKDVLGTIREVIDKDGIVKCSYDYTPFGKVINSSGDETLLSINDILFKGYVYDKETELYWLSSRYYSPELCRFISPDSVDYLDPESINGLNLYAYCGNDPINKYDPTGHFAITLTTLLIGGLIAGAIGAGIGLGTAIYKDVKEDGVWFNGDWTDYVGRTLGGFVAGFGVGVCTVLGAGVGAAALGGTTATLFTSTGLTLSLGSAIGIGSGVAFATGMAGYAVRTGISRSEDFKVQNMFIEGGFNAVSGALSVLGGYLGGMAGLHNTVFTKLLSQKGDFWLRLLVENVFTAGFKLINALIKPYFMI